MIVAHIKEVERACGDRSLRSADVGRIAAEVKVGEVVEVVVRIGRADWCDLLRLHESDRYRVPGKRIRIEQVVAVFEDSQPQPCTRRESQKALFGNGVLRVIGRPDSVHDASYCPQIAVGILVAFRIARIHACPSPWNVVIIQPKPARTPHTSRAEADKLGVRWIAINCFYAAPLELALHRLGCERGVWHVGPLERCGRLHQILDARSYDIPRPTARQHVIGLCLPLGAHSRTAGGTIAPPLRIDHEVHVDSPVATNRFPS